MINKRSLICMFKHLRELEVLALFQIWIVSSGTITQEPSLTLLLQLHCHCFTLTFNDLENMDEVRDYFPLQVQTTYFRFDLILACAWSVQLQAILVLSPHAKEVSN